MDVSFYLSLERHSWSFPDWDMKPEHSSIPSPSCIPKGMPAARLSKDTSGTHIHTKHSSLRTAVGILRCPSIQQTSTPFLVSPKAAEYHWNSHIIVGTQFCKIATEFFLLLFQYLLLVFLMHFSLALTPPCISRLIKHLHLQLFQSFSPLLSPKEGGAQHLAVGQTPCCTCACSGRSVFSLSRLLPWGQWEGIDGWTEDLRGGLGHRSPPCVPALWVEWTKCLLTGTNTQLFGDLPLGQPTQTHSTSCPTLPSPLFLETIKEERGKEGV